jgi:hypothetical protein
MPPTGGVRATGQADPHLVISERHPVDAVLPQSMPQSDQRPAAAGQVLVSDDQDPSGEAQFHDPRMPQPTVPRIGNNDGPRGPNNPQPVTLGDPPLPTTTAWARHVSALGRWLFADFGVVRG